jgi:LysR family transcriptional regulator of abg operon
MNLRLHQMRALVAVVEHGSIRSAARALHVSQTALTKSLRQLEEESEVILLVRNSRGVRLTPAGERLFVRANLISRQMELASEELNASAHTSGGTIRAAISPMISFEQIGRAIKKFRYRYPRVQLTLLDGVTARAVEQLRSGAVDCAFVGVVGDAFKDQFNVQRLHSFALKIMVREDHPIRSNPTAEVLSKLEWIMSVSRHKGGSSILQAMFEAAGVAPPEWMLLYDTGNALSLLRYTYAVALVPEVWQGQVGLQGVVEIKVPELNPGAMDISLLTLPDVPLTAPLQHFIDCTVEMLSEQSAQPLEPAYASPQAQPFFSILEDPL